VYSGPGAADRAVDHAAAAAAAVDSECALERTELSENVIRTAECDTLADLHAAAVSSAPGTAHSRCARMTVDSSIACVACHEH
jgi:hypothetical protein